MPNYRRARVPGPTYFFTVNLRDRSSDLLIREIDLLREAVRATRLRHPFHIDAWVVLPEHMHCMWTLPPGDADFALRWKVIKFAFAKRVPLTETRTINQQRRRERGIWQRRYWEHLIRDERDYQRHFDYIHYNPSNTGMSNGWRTGPIRAFTAPWHRVCIQKTGALRRSRPRAVLGSEPVTHQPPQRWMDKASSTLLAKACLASGYFFLSSLPTS